MLKFARLAFAMMVRVIGGCCVPALPRQGLGRGADRGEGEAACWEGEARNVGRGWSSSQLVGVLTVLPCPGASRWEVDRRGSGGAQAGGVVLRVGGESED
eukprot:TRINITY_DN37785_c0_g1_i1.p1 TRINITY_DN37785_c0_g1~~TRINITY_DN37785_c0_g1_i1.p1  ORF type:complete len:100 (+),score=17.48 TRINITY_DN37785_c0_g1_i1:294-593(+)